MPRRARIALAGIPWHIFHRGNNRTSCFFAPSDYSLYLRILAELSAKFECPLHAYVLMTNHVHLLITPPHEDSAALLMKNLAQRYTQFINRRDSRSGTLWEGRFKSSIAQDDAYALTCYRYIELNPVRAKMVTHPGSYLWSSYRTNGEGKPSSIITPHPDYLALGPTHEERVARYVKLVASGITDDELGKIRRAIAGNFALGNDLFLSALEQRLNKQVAPRNKRTPKGDRPLSE